MTKTTKKSRLSVKCNGGKKTPRLEPEAMAGVLVLSNVMMQLCNVTAKKTVP